MASSTVTAERIEAALAIAPRGSRSLGAVRVEIGEDVTVEAFALATPHCVIVPIDAQLPDGGFVRAQLQVDHKTWGKIVDAAERIGGVPVITNMISRYADRRADMRLLLPRGGDDE
jgi:hypothetical protein